MLSMAEMAANDPHTNEYFKRARLEKSAGNWSGLLAPTPMPPSVSSSCPLCGRSSCMAVGLAIFCCSFKSFSQGLYQHCNKNSREQLNIDFHSSRTAEVQKNKKNSNNHRRLPQIDCPSFISSPTRSLLASLGQVKAYLRSFTN